MQQLRKLPAFVEHLDNIILGAWRCSPEGAGEELSFKLLEEVEKGFDVLDNLMVSGKNNMRIVLFVGIQNFGNCVTSHLEQAPKRLGAGHDWRAGAMLGKTMKDGSYKLKWTEETRDNVDGGEGTYHTRMIPTGVCGRRRW
jgi:hypothetical protein